jgi:ABC-type multidrug transport system ATPase subunit
MTPMRTDTPPSAEASAFAKAPADKPAGRPAIEIRNLVRRYGRTDAVNGLNLRVEPGRCYGFFGRNGAGKTTTIKCLLNLLRPTSGEARVFGLDPARDEVAVKSRLAYVPDNVAFYPWMTVRTTLDYFASFRTRWNRDTEKALLDQFRLDPRQKTSHLSKGQKTQVALITAVCAEPDLLVLDEPTSGLDPIVRREFIQTIIGAYQDAEPGRRTVFVSTHLISEFEGLIDDFTIIEQGREALTLTADAARARYQKIYARFATEPAALDLAGARVLRRSPRDIEVVVNGNAADVMDRLRARSPEALTTESLTLEEIFITTLHPEAAGA